MEGASEFPDFFFLGGQLELQLGHLLFLGRKRLSDLLQGGHRGRVGRLEPFDLNSMTFLRLLQITLEDFHLSRQLANLQLDSRQLRLLLLSLLNRHPLVQAAL